MSIIVTDLSTLLDMLEAADQAIPDPNDYDGWWCIQHKPIMCDGCGGYVCYVEPPQVHLIVVWEEKDDECMLKMAARLKDIDYDPLIIQYAPIMGRCIPFDEVKKVT